MAHREEMAHEVWGVYSVRDHQRPRAFVADVVIFDRLVVPVPPAPDSASPGLEGQWAEWEDAGWDPAAQRQVLAVLGDRAYQVGWGTANRLHWQREYLAAKAVDEFASPYRVTAGVLAKELPPHVTGMNAVAAYASKQDLEEAVGLAEPVPGSELVAVMGREFLVPDPAAYNSDGDLLKAAVDLSGDRDFRRKRTSYWRWQREFLSEQVTSRVAIDDAVEEMSDLLADEARAVRTQRIRTVTMFAFCVAGAAVGIAAAPLTPLALGGAFLSVGQFGAERFFSARQASAPSPAALFYDARKQFGWD